jgi:hypothetical protein
MNSALAIADDKTLTANNTLTLAGVDSTTITFQGTDTYVGRSTTDTLSNKTLTSPTVNGGTHTGITSFGMRSTGAGAFDLVLANNETLAAARTVTLKVNDANRTLDLAGNLTVAGAVSLPAIAQGHLWYGSAVGIISALAKNTSATRYLSNSGASNNPVWSQIDLSNGVTGTLPVANGGTGDTGTAWTSYTPTLTPDNGHTLTTTTVSAATKTLGKTVFIRIRVAIVAVGTATISDGLTITVPFTLAGEAAFACVETNALGLPFYARGAAGSTSIYVLSNGGGGWLANGRAITVTGIYERT